MMMMMRKGVLYALIELVGYYNSVKYTTEDNQSMLVFMEILFNNLLVNHHILLKKYIVDETIMSGKCSSIYFLTHRIGGLLT